MDASEIRSLLRARPFYPFTIQTDHGEKYTVRHPETLLIMKRTVIHAEPEATTFSVISIPHIAAIEQTVPYVMEEEP